MFLSEGGWGVGPTNGGFQQFEDDFLGVLRRVRIRMFGDCWGCAAMRQKAFLEGIWKPLTEKPAVTEVEASLQLG